MRVQLRGLAGGALALCLALPTRAFADGEVSVRGAYYKEKSTRVAQPMVDARFDVGQNGSLEAHFLLDAITSASGAAGAVGEAFTEQRAEGGLSYLHRIGDWGFGLGGRISDEPDYKSRFAILRGLRELAQKNTTLSVAAALGKDEISNASSQGGLMSAFSDDLSTALGSVSVSQILSPVLVASATYDFTYLHGYQANPYRLVPAGGTLESERVPDKRYRNAMHVGLRGWLAPTRTAVFTGYRLYADDWGIIGHTPELRVIQEIVPNLDVVGRYRFHYQNGADFYEDVYDSADPAMEPFLTADEKLGPMITHTFGLKVDVALSALGIPGPGGKWRTEALFEYIVQNTDFGNAVNLQLAVTVPFEY